MRRGDNIPPVSDYAHWNEDAQRIWYEENRYDMEHWDEEIEDDRDPDFEPEPFTDEFETEAEALAFYHSLPDTPRDKPGEWAGTWYVEHWDKTAHDARMRTNKRRGH